MIIFLSFSTIAYDYILKISGKSIARRNPWFKDDCKEIIAKLQKRLTYCQTWAYLLSRAQALRTVSQTGKNYCRYHVSRLNNRKSPNLFVVPFAAWMARGVELWVFPLIYPHRLLLLPIHVRLPMPTSLKTFSSSNCSDVLSVHRTRHEQHPINLNFSNFNDYNSFQSSRTLNISIQIAQFDPMSWWYSDGTASLNTCHHNH